MPLSLVVFTISALFAFVMSTHAESEYGGIVRGKIVRAGEPMPNMQVTLEDESGQQYAPVFTDRAGIFIISGVKAGKYKVVVGRGDQPNRNEITAGSDVTNIPPIEFAGKVEAPNTSFALSPAPVSPGSITTEEARTFVKSHMTAMETGDLEAVMATYAPRVDYYTDGVRDREFILEDQRKYLRRFTRRTYKLGPIDVVRGQGADVPSSDSNSIRVRFSFHYSVSLPGKPDKSGTASELWVLRKNNGQVQIIDCKENVITFNPVCDLPFAGVRNPSIDDNCGIQGGSSDLAKQAESRTKNNFCAATRSLRVITYQELVSLQRESENIPKSLADRAMLAKLGEGQYISYVAFIKSAHYSDVAAGEAVNCNIPGNSTNDIHIVLLKDPRDDECLSTTAEMSPHYRPADWTPENLLKASAGHPVRLKGQLFFDGSHTPCSGASRPNPKRASLWEIHPVYSVEVCTQATIAECQSTTAEWTPMANVVSSDHQ